MPLTKLTLEELKKIANETKNSHIKALIPKDPINNRFDYSVTLRRKTKKIFEKKY